MSDQDLTYIERLARRIWWAAGGETPMYPENEASLWLGYAVLALTKGTATTSEDVHDAWSAWAVTAYPFKHRSAVPFDQLSPEVRAYDDEYRDAIHLVAVK